MKEEYISGWDDDNDGDEEEDHNADKTQQPFDKKCQPYWSHW